MNNQLISNEKFTSIQEAQAGLTKLLEKAKEKGTFYRVMKNNKPLGVLLPDKMWESLVEDLQAFSSKAYLEDIKQARSSEKRYSAEETKKELDI